MKNDYYVYLHKTLNGDVFYVGKGRAQRAWKTHGRSKSWQKVASSGYSVEMYAENLLEKDALEIENGLVKNFKGLVNITVSNPIEFNDISEYFVYDAESPSGLTRIKGVMGGRGHKHERGKLGPCGTKTARNGGDQHWGITFKKRSLLVHRIIWEITYDKIPKGFVVDHIDGNALNNQLSNLRLITQEENSRNAKKAKDNSSGVTGVCFQPKGERNLAKWVAYFSNPSGKQITKYFSVKEFGYDEAFRLACEWRAEQIRNMNNQGAGYTDRHGT